MKMADVEKDVRVVGQRWKEMVITIPLGIEGM